MIQSCAISQIGLCLYRSETLKVIHKKHKFERAGSSLKTRSSLVYFSSGRSIGCGCTKGFDDPVPRASTKEQVKKDGKWVAEHLESINVVLLGDETNLNFALASMLAPVLKYSPLHTPLILRQLKNKTVNEIIAEDGGEEELGLSEVMVFESFSSYLRCVISTCGDGIGAAARAACWRYIFGALTIWIDLGDESRSKPQDEAYSQCDIRLKIRARNNHLLADKDHTDASKLASAILPQLLSAIKSKLKEDQDLCTKKGLYIRMGSRGDWPNMKPPDWSPTNNSL
eukprot:g450.t1